MFWDRNESSPYGSIYHGKLSVLELRPESVGQLCWESDHAQSVLVSELASSEGAVAGRNQNSFDHLTVQVANLQRSNMNNWVWEGNENSGKRKLVQTA